MILEKVCFAWACCSFIGPAQLVNAHVHFHCATTVPPSRNLARQALLFLRRFVLSFFVPLIITVFYLIDRVTKNRKRRGCEGGYIGTSGKCMNVCVYCVCVCVCVYCVCVGHTSVAVRDRSADSDLSPSPTPPLFFPTFVVNTFLPKNVWGCGCTCRLSAFLKQHYPNVM